jgi:hypothetical protein
MFQTVSNGFRGKPLKRLQFSSEKRFVTSLQRGVNDKHFLFLAWAELD